MTAIATLNVSRLEQQSIKQQLALRFNHAQGCYEIYTTIHGTRNLFRWIRISIADARWYERQFNLTAENYHG